MVQSTGSSTASLKPQRPATHHSLGWRCKPRHSAHFNGAEPQLVASSSHSHSMKSACQQKYPQNHHFFNWFTMVCTGTGLWKSAGGAIFQNMIHESHQFAEKCFRLSFQYYSFSLFWAPGLKPASLNNSSIMAIWSRKLGFIMNLPVCLGNDHVGTALTPHL